MPGTVPWPCRTCQPDNALMRLGRVTMRLSGGLVRRLVVVLAAVLGRLGMTGLRHCSPSCWRPDTDAQSRIVCTELSCSCNASMTRDAVAVRIAGHIDREPARAALCGRNRYGIQISRTPSHRRRGHRQDLRRRAAVASTLVAGLELAQWCPDPGSGRAMGRPAESWLAQTPQRLFTRSVWRTGSPSAI